MEAAGHRCQQARLQSECSISAIHFPPWARLLAPSSRGGAAVRCPHSWNMALCAAGGAGPSMADGTRGCKTPEVPSWAGFEQLVSGGKSHIRNLRNLGSVSSAVLGCSASSQGMCSWSAVAGDCFGFPAAPDTAPRHCNMVCSSLAVFPPVKCFNLFDGAFNTVLFCYGSLLWGDDAKEKHLKARAGYT